MTRNGVVISLSGGMDSAVLATKAKIVYGAKNVYAIGFDYGQKHRLELMMAASVAEILEIPFEVIELPKIFAGAGSTLVDSDRPVEHVGSYHDLAQRFGSQPTVVPNRNMNFISMSTTYALTHGVNQVWLGVHAGDAHNYHYPDCRPPFIGSMAAAIDIATEGQVQLIAPFNLMSKADIVTVGAALKAPLAFTLSCYRGERPACGTCATCLERLQAFYQAGYDDPIEYQTYPDWYELARPQLKAFPTTVHQPPLF